MKWTDERVKEFVKVATSGSYGDYLRGKFKQMQSNFIMWIAGLDYKNRERLANNITKGETNE